MKCTALLAALLLGAGCGAGDAADLGSGRPLYGSSYSVVPHLFPGCEDVARQRGFRCITRVTIDADDAPWADELTTIPGSTRPPYPEVYRRPRG